MSTETTPAGAERPVVLFALLLRLAGGALLLLTVLYNQIIIQWVTRADSLRPKIVSGIQESQMVYAVVGLMFLGAGWGVSRGARSRPHWFGGWRLNLSLSLFAMLFPLLVAEVALRPYAGVEQQPTNIFLRDPDLDWRLRPNATGIWGGADVTINEKGLRGPSIPYERIPDETRILYLGDSVTFGYALPEYSDAFPYQVEAILEEQGFGPVETVNAGVGGYSPWQSYRYLADEGLRYRPDLIVYGFVLNDVTEKFGLVRFGGSGVGYQLDNAVFDWIDWLTLRSSIVFFATELGHRFRFGSDKAAGAAALERVDVHDLIFKPDDPLVVEAWEITLADFSDIVDLAAVEDIPLLLVIFPFSTQLDNPLQNPPQLRLQAFAAENDVSNFDLLPPLADFKVERAVNVDMIFFDGTHLTVGGSQLVGQLLAKPVQAALEADRE